MNFRNALRIQSGESISFSGAGGKTTALFTLARELPDPVLVTTTTHFSVEQLKLADNIRFSSQVQDAESFVNSLSPGITVLAGEEVNDQRVSGPSLHVLDQIYQHTRSAGRNLLIETDGSRQRPLKAPASYEPVIPQFIDHAVVVVGLSALGRPFSSRYVHRIEEFTRITSLSEGEEIPLEAITQVLTHPNGGLRGIPDNARRICLINQADNEMLQASAKRIAGSLLTEYDSIIIASLRRKGEEIRKSTVIDPVPGICEIYGVHEPITAVILAAGGSTRMGNPKQLIPWQGTSLIRHVVSRVLISGVIHTIVVLGAYLDETRQEIEDLPVQVVVNSNWEAGQSKSIQVGLEVTPENTGGVLFVLVDQPFVSVPLIRALIEKHAQTLAPVIVPLVDGQRGNPVLFDRSTIPDFKTIQGDSGGRQLFSRHQVTWVEWHDQKVLLDIDTEQDYQGIDPGTG